MYFNNGLINAISKEHIYRLRGKSIHRATRIDAEMLNTVPPKILDGIKYSRFDNSQTHILKLNKIQPGHQNSEGRDPFYLYQTF